MGTWNVRKDKEDEMKERQIKMCICEAKRRGKYVIVLTKGSLSCEVESVNICQKEKI